MLWQRYPSVLKIDTTANTNNKECPLLLGVGRTPDGEAFTAFQAFLPNERAWVFWWIFHRVLPILLGEKHLKRTRIFITDGDSTEITQLVTKVNQSYPNALRVRCGWHLVAQGWRENGPTSRSVLKEKETELLALSNRV